MNEKLAHEFIEAIRTIAEKSENLDNFESYLSNHFEAWMKEYANTPETLTAEIKHFAEMEI